MENKYFEIYVNGSCMATCFNLDTVKILVEGFNNTYFAEPILDVRVVRKKVEPAVSNTAPTEITFPESDLTEEKTVKKIKKEKK